MWGEFPDLPANWWPHSPNSSHATMASIRPYKAGWRAQLYVAGQRDSATFDTKREATTWAEVRAQELRTIAKGGEGKLRTIQNALERYAAEVSPTHKGERWERLRLSLIARQMPAVTMDRLSEVHIQQWRDARLRQVSPASVLREMKLLGAVLEQARREWKWISVNPAKDVRKPKGAPARDRAMTRAEIRKLLRALSGTDQRAAVGNALRLALRTGMRASELAGLTWEAIQGTHAVLADSKNDDRRIVPLSGKARMMLTRMPRTGDLVLGVTAAAIDVQFRKARARAGLDGLHFHDSRHTAATWIGRSGRITVLEMCAMFGWRDPRHAMVYFNPSPADIASRL